MSPKPFHETIVVQLMNGCIVHPAEFECAYSLVAETLVPKNHTAIARAMIECLARHDRKDDKEVLLKLANEQRSFAGLNPDEKRAKWMVNGWLQAGGYPPRYVDPDGAPASDEATTETAPAEPKSAK